MKRPTMYVFVIMSLIFSIVSCSDSGGSAPADIDTNDITDTMNNDTQSEKDTNSQTDISSDTSSIEDTSSISSTDSTTVDSESESETESESESETGPLQVLEITQITPQAAHNLVNQEFVILGSLFANNMTVQLVLEQTTTTLTVVSVSDDFTVANVQLTADSSLPQGLYDLVITPVDAEPVTLENAIFISTQPPPTITDIEPAFAWQGSSSDGILSDKIVRITGENFINTPWITWINVTNPDVQYDAVWVNFIDENTLIAAVPAESGSMALGSYHVWVKNPDTLASQWKDELTSTPNTFEIISEAPPTITAINPVQYPFNEECSPLTLTGQNFDASATVSLMVDDTELTLATTSITQDTIVTSIAAETVTQGVYPIKVTNPDGQYDIFYAFESTSPTDGHLTGDFGNLTPLLNTPRERLALTFGFDMYGGTHLYAGGGLDATNTVLTTVETASVNLQGEVGAWSVLQQWDDNTKSRVDCTFNTSRQGHALVHVNNQIYAIGGSSSDTTTGDNAPADALSSIEVASILDDTQIPTIASITTSDSPGLPKGTWYYQVSAIGLWGESLTSKEVQQLNAKGVIKICWDAVDNATGYNIYRSKAADGRPGTTTLIDTVNTTSTCYSDSGETIPAPGFLSASLADAGTLAEGIWIYQVTATDMNGESVAGYRVPIETDAVQKTVSLSWNPVEGATYNVYRIEAAASQQTGDETTYLIAEGLTDTNWVDNGSLSVDKSSAMPTGMVPLPVGSLSVWQPAAVSLNVEREGLSATYVTDGTDTYIVAAGGRRDNTGTPEYLTSVEVCKLDANNALTDCTLSANALNTPRAFFTLLTTPANPTNPFALPTPSTTTPFLIAVTGDDSFDTVTNNKGLQTIEMAPMTFDVSSLTISKWEVQSGNLQSGRATYGNGATVVDNYLYIFPGVCEESAGEDTNSVDYEPVPIDSTSSRFKINIPQTLPDPYVDLLSSFMASNGAFQINRSYYGMTRVNSHIFVVGGNDGIGPTGTMEAIKQ